MVAPYRRDLLMGPYLTVSKAAEYLGIKKSTLYKWVRLNKAPHAKLGTRIVFDPECLDAWVKENSRQTKAPVQRKGGIYGEF